MEINASQSQNEVFAVSLQPLFSGAQCETILSHIADGVLMVDENGVVIFENEAARAIYRVSLVGANIVETLPQWTILNSERQPFTRETLPLNRVVLFGEEIRGEDIIVPFLPTEEYVIQISAAPIRDENGRQLGSVLTLRNVTEQRRLTRELREMNQSKDEFLAILSHELRTPLTPILGWATLLKQIGSTNEELFEQAVTAIERNAELLKRLVNDLLDTTRIVSGKLSTEKTLCDINTIARFAVQTLDEESRERDVRIQTELSKDLPNFWCDRERIQQVLMNLLTNAIKFSEPKQTIQLRTRQDDSVASSTRIVVEIEDFGQGIAPEFLPHIFDLFRQGDSSFTRRHGGLGLGLAISKSLVEMHGGTLTAQSEGVGKGALFTVTLPMKANDET